MKKTVKYTIIVFIIMGAWFSGYTFRKPYFADVAKNEYTNGYKCLQFSQNLVQKLKDRGIQSEVVIGYQPDGTHHAWVGVWIEPQTGKFTKNYTKESHGN
jgi:hypothetical protein